MRRILSAVAILAIVVFAGCEDSPTDPTGQPIVGTWKASKVGQVFAAGSTMEATFESGGDVDIEVGGATWSGAYTTSGSSASSTIRNITISITSPQTMSFSGIYSISGSQMKLELVPVPVPDNVTAPDAAVGIGSATEGGSTTSKYVSELQKQ